MYLGTRWGCGGIEAAKTRSRVAGSRTECVVTRGRDRVSSAARSLRCMPTFHPAPAGLVTGVFHVYDNGVRCVAAPCHHYTVRSTQGSEYSASRLNVEALEPAARGGASSALYGGLWMVRGTIEASASPKPNMPNVELRVEQIVESIDARASRLLHARLTQSEDLSSHLLVLRETLASIAVRSEIGGSPDQNLVSSLGQLRDEFDDLARRYDGFGEQNGRGRSADLSSEQLASALADLFSRVLVLAVRHFTGADALAATWLVGP